MNGHVELLHKHDDNIPSDDALKLAYPEVDAMAIWMRRQLWLNRAKGNRPGWLAMSSWDCWNELQWHAAKLSMALKIANPDLQRQYAADCANISMFLLDGLELLCNQ